MTFDTQATSNVTTTPDAVREVLQRLRNRIRGYVVLEGLAMLVICSVLAFWVGFAMDYLPVLAGANEMPRTARIVVLSIAGALAAWVLYHFILRRVFRVLRDSSLALLIERQFPAFRDGLVTTIELSEFATSAHQQPRWTPEEAARFTPLGSSMLARTVHHAAATVDEVQLSKVFRYTPLATKGVGAMAAVLSLVIFGVLAPNALATAAARLLWLRDDPWPRHAYIEMVGFPDGERKIARGTDLVVNVRADATRPVPAPQLCTILYETEDGDRGRVNMSRDGEPRDGYQYYVFNGKPFKGILNDIQFDVIGYDYRLRDQRVKVVLSPVVTSVELRAELPAYTQLLPREELWTPGIQLPIGSHVAATIRTNKDIVQMTRRDIDTGEVTTTELTASDADREVVHEIPQLEGRHAVSITLLDTDGIESLEPFLLTIGAIEDTAPMVDVSLRGIGTAITPQARLPVEGSIRDDYEVARCWFDLQVNDDHREFEILQTDTESLQFALDLRAEAAADQQQPLVLQPQDRVVFSVKASDHFDLGGETHVGSNEQVVLSVVRPDELLAILDGRELGLRRRFEQIRTETVQSRDSLARLRASFNETTTSEEDADVDTETAARNTANLRERWASWALQKTAQTILEVRGVALAFDDIREELVNNRVDTPERKLRLEEQIIAPLQQIAEQLLPALQQQVGTLQVALQEQQQDAESQAVQAVVRADQVVVAMEAVLEKMLELEDYTELVNLIRQILEEQQDLMSRTKQERDRGVLDLLK